MDPKNAIEVRNLKKSFKVYYDKGNELKERLLFWGRSRYEKRTVLDGISFGVKKGEAVGLIGHNGCGKSTVLKLLTRIIYPDEGTVEMRGRVSSLIELGAGFHPDMSGRENIRTNAAIFGLNRKEIDRRMDGIIGFSELGEYIDSPVRTYSSGMYMRLAFSVAVNVDADILLIDEILAVGDAGFQAKCFDKLREIKSQGTTIVIVSHSLGQIEQFCDKSIWIHKGRIEKEGDPSAVDMEYLDYMGRYRVKGQNASERKGDDREDFDEESKSEGQNRKAEIVGCFFCDKNGRKTNFKVGSEVYLNVHYRKYEDLHEPLMGLKIYRNDKVLVFGINSKNEKFALEMENEGWITLRIPSLNLVQGEYHIDLAIREYNMTICDYKTDIITFTTYNDVEEVGIAHLAHEWSMQNESLLQMPEND